jgi:hypothetical protein
MTALSIIGALEGDPATLALIAIVGTVITALFKLLNDNTKALSNLSKSNEMIADETAKGNREAKQRNGHLGDQNIKITEMIAKLGKQVNDNANRNFRALSNVKEQHVEHQHVFSETVENEVINNKERK